MKCINATGKNMKRFFLVISLVWLWISPVAILYGQGTLVETVGTMEISQQVDNGVNQNAQRGTPDTKTPAQDTNNATQSPNRNPNQMRGRPNPPPPPQDAQQQEQTPAPAVLETPMAAPAMTGEANVPDVNDFNAFKRELDRIDMSARGEDTQWLGKLEKKADIAQAMNNVVVAELGFLRKVAASANDVNTVEAIDLVLKKRQDRLSKLVTKLENEVKDERRQQVGERQQRRPARTTGGAQPQDQTQIERPARTPNPMRRAVGGGE